MKIELDKNTLENFDTALQTEWLEINNLGVYSSSTIYGLNNRRFHGLFNIPAKEPGRKFNLLSKFEETVFIKDHSFELSTNQYENSVYPSGYKHLEKFSLDPFPKFSFLIANRKIEKILLLIHDKNLLLVRYALKNNGEPVKLVIKPIIGSRYTDELLQDIQGINPDSYIEGNIVKIAPKSDIPELNIFYSKGEYIPAPLWYHNYLYKRDYSSKENILKEKEDLLNPGFFTCDLRPYDTLDLFIYINDWMDYNFEELYRKEIEYRRSIKPHLRKLPSFIQKVSKKVETVSLANNKSSTFCNLDLFLSECDNRESLLAQFGILIVQQDEKIIIQIIENLIQQLENGLLFCKNQNKDNYTNIYADTSLILINLGYHIYRLLKNKEFLENKMFEPFMKIIEHYRKGTNFNIYMDKDGLIFSGDKNTNTSFISLNTENGKVLRYGKLLEVNTYWINALNIMKFFSEELAKKRLIKKFEKLGTKALNSFIGEFWDEENNRLFDLVRNHLKDNSFRINQISILALPFPILDIEKGWQLLKSINAELLTPYGLRSLSVKDINYISNLNPEIDKSNPEYYNGAVWPWSIGDYITASVKYRLENSNGFGNLKEMIENFEILYKENCLGYFSEIVQSEEPYQAGGRVAFLLNMTEFLKGAFYLFVVENKN